MDNATILRKADLEIQDLLTDGGHLETATAKKFIHRLIEKAVVINQVMVYPMKSKKEKVPGIRFASRILRAGVSNQALPESQRAKPTTDDIELDAKLIKGQVDLNDEVLEDNIEQETLKSTVMGLIADRTATDLDELTVQGDTTSADAYLALYNGWLQATTSHLVDAGILPLTDNPLKQAIKAIPKPALRERSKMRFFTSVRAEIDYRDYLSQRGDALGARVHDEWKPVKYHGIPIIPVDLFPENLGVGTNETNVILCDAKNWIHGIWRRIRLETQRDATAGVLMIVPTLRCDGKWGYEDFTVKVQKVQVA